MGKDIEIGTRTHGDVWIVDISGDVTALTGEAIEEAYRKVCQAGSKKIVFHFAEHVYINSGGIAFLIGIASESKKLGQTVRITGLSAHFHKIFDMVGLTRYLSIFPSEEAALEGL